MLSKILLTLSILLVIYGAVRARLRAGRARQGPRLTPRPPLISPARVKLLAYGLLVAMVSGSMLLLYIGWEDGREVVGVRVINANTGAMVLYQARRADVEGRQFTTLDGRRVLLAEVERLVIE